MKDFPKALEHYKKCLRKDQQPQQEEKEKKKMSELTKKMAKADQDVRELFSSQFIKAYFNVGVICDRYGDYAAAKAWYSRAVHQSFGEKWPEEPLGEDVFIEEVALKAASNLAICLEKLNERTKALLIYEGLKDHIIDSGLFKKKAMQASPCLEEVANNLGVIYKRMQQYDKSNQLYQLAQDVAQAKEQDIQIQVINNSRKTLKSDLDIYQSSHPDLIKFFPLYNNGISFASQEKFKDAVLKFKESLKIIQEITVDEQRTRAKKKGARYDPPTSWAALGKLGAQERYLIYLVSIFTNLAMCYEKLLMFRSARGCIARAVMLSPDSVKLMRMRDRLEVIVDAFDSGQLTLNDFDKKHFSMRFSRQPDNFEEIGDEDEFKWAQEPKQKKVKLMKQPSDALQIVVQDAQAELEERRLASAAAAAEAEKKKKEESAV